MILQDLHVHTVFCDGKNTPEELVASAIKKGMKRIGFSGHSYTFFDKSYCMSAKGTEKYKLEIDRLKEKYKNEIEILCGIEHDYYSEASTKGYDYVIGSVHYIKIANEYIPVDESCEILNDAANRFFDGDFYALAEEYFKTVSDVVNKINADIIGHFDLISKFNSENALFDENNSRYINAYKKAIDAIILSGKPFEINTGAVSRGYKNEPYPSKDILCYIAEKGGVFVLNSDAHSADALCYGFEVLTERLKNTGIKIVDFLR